MALKKITRLRPADLQQVQAQTTNNVPVADVIASLQSAKSTQQAPLNTSCPTCAVDGAPQGFVSATTGTLTMDIPCPTCKGYLLYHTANGQVTPPVNPFQNPLTVARLLPADLQQAITGFPASTTLETLIVSLQANFDQPLTFNCPQCTHTGWITVRNAATMCPTCAGWQKTAIQYTIVNGRVTRSNN